MNSFIKQCFFTLWLLFLLVPSVQARYVDDANIVINLPSRTLELYSGDRFIKEYSVAIGTPGTPTPSGTYKIYFKEKNPTWYPTDGRPPVESGPYNPLGYRWMEFAPTYGIHGTDSPWSIGNWASHGCVRMHERDVEDLFELIPVGTPLKITYERVKVRVTEDGKALVGVYPDVYGRQSLSLQKVKNQLANYPFAPFVSDDQIRQLINRVPDKAIVLAKSYRLQVNQKRLGQDAIATGTEQDVFYIPVQTVAQYLNIPVQVEQSQGKVTTNYGQAESVTKNKEVYVKSGQVKSIFPVEVVTDKESATIQLKALLVSINEKVYPMAVKKTEQGLALPLNEVAEKLHKTVNSKTFQPLMIDGKPYILTDQIATYFDVFVYYNEVGSMIEINSNE